MLLLEIFLVALGVLLLAFIVAIIVLRVNSDSATDHSPAGLGGPADRADVTDRSDLVTVGGGDQAFPQQTAGPDRPPFGGGESSANGRGQPAAPRPAPRPASRPALRNWRVRSRLFLLVLIPTIAALIFGGLRIASSVQSAIAYQRIERLATLSGDITGLAQALQTEREDTITYIVLSSPDGGRGASRSDAKAELTVLHNDYHVTDGLATQVLTGLDAIGSSYPAVDRQDAADARAAIRRIPALRTAAMSTGQSATAVIESYASAITSLQELNGQVADGSTDTTLAGTVRAASLVSEIKEDASQQQAILTSALGPYLSGVAQWGPSQQAAINNALSAQQGNLSEFYAAATPAQRQLYRSALAGPANGGAHALVQQAVALANRGHVAAGDTTVYNASQAIYQVVSSLRSAEEHLFGSAVAQSKVLRSSAVTSVIIDSILVLVVLALVLLLTAMVSSSLVRPLRRLRAGALEVAGMRLPEAVRQMNESDGADVTMDIEPIDVDSSDEIGEVARAFDQVHREAVQLAANEAALRGNVNAMFVNLSRRSQSLVERQIRLIDELEQGEQDSERLSSLFQMDHLATRMRRNSENLLVLAGHDVSRRWNQTVSLVDVLRAAVSEIEQYERVTLNVQPGIAVRGQAVSDVVHLTAELVENATSFSPADTPVTIVGHLLGSGGVLLEIADQGVGMGAEEMAHANWRLDNPPVVDVAVSRRMGLFVVARLAARHGIRVRLRPATPGGLTALVWLPDEVVTHDGLGTSPGDRMFDAAALGAATGAVGAATGAAAASAGFADWDEPGRSAAEQEVTAARTPRFGPLRVDADESAVPQRRVPGAGPRPGAPAWAEAGATGPLPVFRTSPQPAPRFDGETADGEADGRLAAGDDANGRDVAGIGTAGREEETMTGPLSAASLADAAPKSAAGSRADFGDLDAGGSMWGGSGASPASEWSSPASQQPASQAGGAPERSSAPEWGSGVPEWAGPTPGRTKGVPANGTSAGGGASSGSPENDTPDDDETQTPGQPPVRSKGGMDADDDAADTGGSSAAGGLVGAGSPAGAEGSTDAGSPSGPAQGAGRGGNRSLSSPRGPNGASDTDSGTRYDWSSGPFGGVVVPPPPAASLGEGNRLPIFEAVESDWFRRGRPATSQPDERRTAANGGGGADAADAAAPPVSGPAVDSPAAGSPGLSEPGLSEPGLSDSDPSSPGLTSPGLSGPGLSDRDASGSRADSVTSTNGASGAEHQSGGWASAADEGWRAAEAVSEPSSAGLTPAGLPKRVPQANLVPGTAAAESPAPAPARSAAATRERLASFQRGIREARAAAAGGETGGGESDESS
ncbi:MAG: nitrate- and nitrite sensing domain-containing protein [Streptosporangiaceae bacterium]|jgi:signal transduction histidine kinase